jgi:hypothetical protein
MDDTEEQRPESLLPYDDWNEEALRHVMVRALAFVAANGLPGEHHFYITFRTDHPDAVVTSRLRAQYPQEMTIVLQHQFWDMTVDEAEGLFSVGLSFGGVPTILKIPFDAVTAFADPHVRYGLRFRTDLTPEAANAEAAQEETNAPTLVTDEPEPAPKPEEGEVVSLDAFRRRTPPRES